MTRNSQMQSDTCDGEGDRPKAAGGVVKVEALFLKQELQLCLAEVIHGIPEVEGCVLAANPAVYSWESPGCCIMCLNGQLPFSLPACGQKFNFADVIVTDNGG